MTVLVALAPGESRNTATSLASVIARSTGDDIVVCTILTTHWPRSLDKPDEEYAAILGRDGRQALEQARDDLPEDVGLRFELHSARSVSTGLLEMVERTGARLLVFGSSSRGAHGRIELGSVTDRMMHSSPVPIAIAPRGFQCPPGEVLTRVNAAYGGPDSLAAAHWAGNFAAEIAVPLRLASFAVRPPTMITAGVGSRAERQIVEEWRRSVEAEQQGAATELAGDHQLTAPVETAIGRGHTWSDALDDISWAPGDVLVVGSSSLAPISRVFLGSRATKILRHSPMPVIAVPRSKHKRHG